MTEYYRNIGVDAEKILRIVSRLVYDSAPGVIDETKKEVLKTDAVVKKYTEKIAGLTSKPKHQK